MGIRSTNTTQSFGSDFYRSGSDVERVINSVYTEDVFHTQLYDGITNGGQTITTNIDLANKGGLVWIKKQDGQQSHALSDTEQGLEYYANTSSAGAFLTSNTRVSSPTSTGFNLGSDTEVNEAGYKYVSWTFRKQPGFFDIVTWDGNPDTGGRTLEHSLGSTPGFIIVKQTTGTAKNWVVWHRSFSSLPVGNHMYLNTQGGVVGNDVVFPSTSPTSTQFSVGEFSNVDGESYVAYLFAHDDHRFGDYEDQDIIKCGKATMPASGDWHDVDLGWEPQWILIKPDTTTTNWQIFDSRRGIVTTGDSGVATGNERALNPNTQDGEETAAEMLELTGNGFRIKVGQYGTNNDVYYVAIRKGIKKPTDATKVFNPKIYSGLGNANPLTQDFEPVDLYDGGRLFWTKIYTGSGNGTGHVLATNKTGLVSLDTDTGSNEVAFANIVWDNPEFVHLNSQYMNNSPNTHISWNFKTAAGFFDIVTWAGNSTANRALTHNLGVEPELITIFRRTGPGTDNRNTYCKYLDNPLSERLFLNTVDNIQGVSNPPEFGTSAPTSSVFHVGSDTAVNISSNNYMALLFASCPGVSKVGTYSGSTGYSIDIDCGFTSSARFIMIKRTDTVIYTSQRETNWWIFDTVRGINPDATNDDVLQANTADPAISTENWISPYAKGFTVNASIAHALNQTGGKYIYLAIA